MWLTNLLTGQKESSCTGSRQKLYEEGVGGGVGTRLANARKRVVGTIQHKVEVIEEVE